MYKIVSVRLLGFMVLISLKPNLRHVFPHNNIISIPDYVAYSTIPMTYHLVNYETAPSTEPRVN